MAVVKSIVSLQSLKTTVAAHGLVDEATKHVDTVALMAHTIVDQHFSVHLASLLEQVPSDQRQNELTEGLAKRRMAALTELMKFANTHRPEYNNPFGVLYKELDDIKPSRGYFSDANQFYSIWHEFKYKVDTLRAKMEGHSGRNESGQSEESYVHDLCMSLHH